LIKEVTMAHAPSFIPILSAGRHRSPKRGACFMEFASFLAGERWSDHPACTHPLLASLARDVNDLTSNSARDRLLPLVHRVIGLDGDDPGLPPLIAVRAAAEALPVASAERQQALAVGMLVQLAANRDAALESIAESGFAAAPQALRWARGYLATARVARNGDRAAHAMVHTAVVGIGLACVDDADARLRRVLELAIDDVESRVRPVSSAIRALQPVE
jgi:hypothetical protein